MTQQLSCFVVWRLSLRNRNRNVAEIFPVSRFHPAVLGDVCVSDVQTVICEVGAQEFDSELDLSTYISRVQYTTVVNFSLKQCAVKCTAKKPSVV